MSIVNKKLKKELSPALKQAIVRRSGGNKLELWKNVVMYVGACLEQQKDATKDEAEIISQEMYEWLTSTYNLSLKVRRK